MQTSVLLFALVFPISSPQTPALTYGKVLGYERVEKVVVEVLNHKVEEYEKAPKTSGAPETLSYEPNLLSIVSERILGSELPPDATPTEATRMLEVGFGHFVDHFVEFAKRKSGPILKLTKDLYNQYMTRPQDQQKCGEIPCNRPPCCHYCDPPPCKKDGC